METKELIQFEKLLDKFIDFCGMEYMDALKKAVELRDIINQNEKN